MKRIHYFKWSWMFCSLVLFVVVSVASFPARASGQQIVVQLMNGKSRKAFSGYRVYIVLGDPYAQHTLDLKTDHDGKVHFDTQGIATFQVRPVGTISCADPAKGTSNPDLDVAEVLRHGLVTRNDCGKFNPEPLRGQVTYLAGNASGWQLFKN
jgi:hypothetical protein